FVPNDLVGSCSPVTPAGDANTFSCKPSFYTSGSSTLKPGVYVWWLTFYRADPGSFQQTLHISGPLQMTVPAPPAPAASLLPPAAGPVVQPQPPVLVAHVPAGAAFAFHASDSPDRLDDGSPLGLDYAGCSGTASQEGSYSCSADTYDPTPGDSYYWWLV